MDQPQILAGQPFQHAGVVAQAVDAHLQALALGAADTLPKPGIGNFAALSLVITAKGIYFLADTHVCPEPSAQEIAETTQLAAAHVRRFGLEAIDRE